MNFVRYYLDGAFDRYRLVPSRATLFADGELYDVRLPTSAIEGNITPEEIAPSSSPACLRPEPAS